MKCLKKNFPGKREKKKKKTTNTEAANFDKHNIYITVSTFYQSCIY